MNLGPTELGITFAIVLVVFGGSRLPQLARRLGQARRELEDASAARPAPAVTPAHDAL